MGIVPSRRPDAIVLPLEQERYPPIAAYGLIGDCHSAALVSHEGSIDWCCLPRFDSDSCFGRLLDWDRGGHLSIRPREASSWRREYLEQTLVLITTYASADGEARLIDFFAMRVGGRTRPRRELVRLIEGVRGVMCFDVRACPRFDFGEVKPWIFGRGEQAFAAVGSNKGLLFYGDVPLELEGEHDLRAEIELRAGERRHLGVQFLVPEEIEAVQVPTYAPRDLDEHLEETRQWWQTWAARLSPLPDAGSGPSVRRSAIVLKALNHAPTGAIVAAVTTSLPETVGGERNWDYRFSWLRDSILTVHSLGQLGCHAEANGFRRFVQRSSAGNADELQVMYAVDGKRRLTEVALGDLEGWRGSRPVRIGNAAAEQFQLDMYGLIMELTWRWSKAGGKPDRHYWDFLFEIVDAACKHWPEPDLGIWEVRSPPRHFVHSKAMCWVAIERGLQLSATHGLPCDRPRWLAERDALRSAIDQHGIDPERGIFVESFGSRELDAALLQLPEMGYIAYDDPLMARTTAAIARELDSGGLILRYRGEDGLTGAEGTFLPCTFWLAECFARQGRLAEARAYFERAAGCANDLGLFTEEFDTRRGEAIGNFPQGLTHLAHIAAALAIDQAARRSPPPPEGMPA